MTAMTFRDRVSRASKEAKRIGPSWGLIFFGAAMIALSALLFLACVG